MQNLNIIFNLLLINLANFCNSASLRRKPNLEEMDKYFEGDIDITEAEIKSLFDPSRLDMSTVMTETNKWPNGIVYYEFAPEFSFQDRSVIEGAMDEISEKTCIIFEEKDTHEDYVKFVDGGGCSSKVGKRGGEQFVTLATDGCVAHGTAIHEIVHALGFWHEQSRLDRDDFVEIKWDNIKPDKYKNFRKYVSTNHEYQVEYDYGSVMHYKSNAFQREDTDDDTIVPKDPDVDIGQRYELSDLDAEKINRLYCKDRKKTKVATTTEDDEESPEEDEFNEI